MKLAAATVLLAPAVFGFAPQQIAFRSRSTLSASTEASTEKKVRYMRRLYLLCTVLCRPIVRIRESFAFVEIYRVKIRHFCDTSMVSPFSPLLRYTYTASLPSPCYLLHHTLSHFLLLLLCKHSRSPSSPLPSRPVSSPERVSSTFSTMPRKLALPFPESTLLEPTPSTRAWKPV
jgi:hypothetical protein